MARDDSPVDALLRPRSSPRSYRLTAAGLFVSGLVVAGLALWRPLADARNLLFAVASVGLFGSILLFFFRPSATSATDPVEGVYTAFVANVEALAADAAVSDRRIYAPTTYERAGLTPVALTVPASDRGVSIDRNRRPVFDADLSASPDALTLYPTGAALFDTFEGMIVMDLSSDPVELADQLVDGIVLGLELADDVAVDVDAVAGTATFGVEGARFGSVTRFDHPVASFLAVGFALGLDVPVMLDAEPASAEHPPRVTCRWSPEQAATADGVSAAQ